MIDNIGHWFIAHPISFGIITLALSSVVSVYAGDLRRFLAIPPQRINIWILKARLANAKESLATLNRFVENQLVFIAYLGRRIGYGLITLNVLAVGLFAQVFSSTPHTHSQKVKMALSVIFLSSMGLFMLTPMVFRCIDVVNGEEARRDLQYKIRRLELLLVAKDPTASGR